MRTDILKRVSTLALMGATACAIVLTASRGHAEDNKITESERAKIEQVVRDMLKSEPEIIIDALKAYDLQQVAKRAEKAKSAIANHADFFNSADRPSIGNPDGDITLVEFFDYNCGYCKRAINDIVTLQKNDPNLRVVFIDFPILSPQSELAAKAALAAHKQGKYFDFHQKAMSTRGKLDENRLKEIAESIGMDTDAMMTYMESDEVRKILEKNREVALDIGVSGTPAFIIGDRFTPGAVGLAEMDRIIKEIRKNRENNIEKE